jgi:hypothetical protein
MKYPAHLVEGIFKSVILNATTPTKNPGRMVLRGRCPKCGDSQRKKSKARLYCLENTSHWAVHCHNCGYNTNFEKMLEEFFPEEAQNLKMLCFDQIKSGSIFKKSTSERKKREPSDEIHEYLEEYFKENCFPLGEVQEDPKKEKFRRYAYNKMKKRNIPDHFINEFLFCYRGSGKLKAYIWRVIIPFKTKDGKYYNFQSRDIHPEPDQQRLDTKYLFATFENFELPDEKIYRVHQVSPNRTVYVCEGILDCLFIENAIALCNANVSGEKADFIKETYEDRVWVLDSPWVDKTGYERACRLLEEGETCFIMPKKYRFENGEYPKDINDLALLLGVKTIPLEIINENLLSGKIGLTKLKVSKMGSGC